jgi:tetratricopeptide (TPR) repeat protein
MLEQIEKYFDNKLSLSERQVFENQMVTNSVLAQEVAFYIQVRSMSKDIADQKRKQEFEILRKKLNKPTNPNIKPILWLSGLAASVILGFGLWGFMSSNSKSIDSLADSYIQQHFENLPVKMDGTQDSLQMGLRLFNEYKIKDSQQIFEDIYKRENKNSEAIRYVGITALRLNEYDKAINYFQILSQQKGLYANPGLFYEAIALLKQSPENKEKAIGIFKEVIAENLEGSEDAKQIIGGIK